VFDVAVDLRKNSPTFLQWFGQLLSPGNRCSMYIPQGCAHGFQAVANNCELVYLHSSAHAPTAEGGIHPLDPAVAIAWPLPVSIMSNRDQGHPMIDNRFEGFYL
jgi:dTDP-4-dehydrorhamnose 3,5-epimerase